jgi:hypothetical protein
MSYALQKENTIVPYMSRSIQVRIQQPFVLT